MKTITTNVLTVKEAMTDRFWTWGTNINDCEFKGVIPGYICGWCVEVQLPRTERVDYCSMTATNDYGEIIMPEPYGDTLDYNDLGISAMCAWEAKGWEPTGNIVFKGYYREYYDTTEHEWFIDNASTEALKEVA